MDVETVVVIEFDHLGLATVGKHKIDVPIRKIAQSRGQSLMVRQIEPSEQDTVFCVLLGDVRKVGGIHEDEVALTRLGG